MELKPGYKQTEVGVIPEEWEVCPVEWKGQVTAGKALAVNAPGEQRPYLRTKNVFDGRIDIDDVLTMPMTEEQFAQFQLRPGDVLLNEGQSLELVGRCSIYRDEHPSPCAIQNALLRFRPKAGTSASFASHLFRNCQKTGIFARIALQTTSVAHLGSSRFASLRLAWPTTNEQISIATALDDIDHLIKSLDDLITKKTNIKQATMQELLTGKRRLPGFEGEWETVALSQVSEKITGFWGRTNPGNEAIHSTNVIRAGDISEEGRLIGAARRYLSHHEFSIAGCKPGDTVMTASGNGLGKSWTCSQGGLYSASNFVRIIRPQKGKADGHFFGYALKSRLARTKLVEHTATSAYPNLKPSFFHDKWLSLPPEPEQKAISGVLHDIDVEVLELEAKKLKASQLKQGMMQQLLTGRIRLQ
jgi:type I restriction enzyme S subunit